MNRRFVWVDQEEDGTIDEIDENKSQRNNQGKVELVEIPSLTVSRLKSWT